MYLCQITKWSYGFENAIVYTVGTIRGCTIFLLNAIQIVGNHNTMHVFHLLK